MFLKKKTLFILSFLLIIPFFKILAEPSSVFPEHYAGITAYTKTEDITGENNLAKLTEIVAFLENHPKAVVLENEETHVIGKFSLDFTVLDDRTSNESYHLFSLSPYIYIDKEGWIASYFNNNTPSSSIINWREYNGEELPPSILEEVIEIVSSGVDISYNDIKYYHFGLEDVDSMSIIIDNINNTDNLLKTNHSLTLPNAPEEASYSIKYTNRLVSHQRCIVDLFVDGKTVNENFFSLLNCGGDNYIYNFYPENTFIKNKPHSLLFEARGGTPSTNIYFRVGTVLLYKN